MGIFQENPNLIQSAVEEFLRYDGSVQLTGRSTKEDVEIGGKLIRQGERVMTVLAAANRDPAQFSDPDRLDITRKDNYHVALGQGIHFCLGASLARAEGQLAIGTLLQRMPRLCFFQDLSARARPASIPVRDCRARQSGRLSGHVAIFCFEEFDD